MVALNNKKNSKICLEDKEIPSDDEEIVPDDEEIVPDDEEILTFGQKIHLAQNPMKRVMAATIIAVVVIAIVVALVVPISYSAITLIDSKGHDEYRLDSRWGPVCNPQLFDDSENYPAQIFVKDDSPAYSSGLRNGDTITKINDVQINNVHELSNWSINLGVVPGETVRVNVLHTDGTVDQLDVTTFPDPEQSDRALLGVDIPIDFTCKAYLFLNDYDIAIGADLELIKWNFNLILTVVIVFGIVIGVGSIKWIPQIIKLRRGLEDWEEEYIDGTYYLALETQKFPKPMDGEILFDVAQEVFPELRKKSGRPEIWDGEIISDNYKFDCFQSTNQDIPELFVGKIFGNKEISFESLKELCEEIKKATKKSKLGKDIEGLKNMEIFRLICVGKKYASKPVEKTDYLDEVVDKLKQDFPIDFILEKDGKYELLQYEI